MTTLNESPRTSTSDLDREPLHAPSPSEITLVSQRIAEIIVDRSKRAESLRLEIDRLRAVESELECLMDTTFNLQTNMDQFVLDSSISEALLEVLDAQRLLEMRNQLSGALVRLQVALRRMSRESVTIAVTGQARMGKSTLLQAITGLGDEQIPTGDDVPVTATQSRVSHIDPNAEASADVVFYTYDEFRDVVLAPFFAALEITGGAPETKSDFTVYELPAINPPRHLEATLTRLRRILAHRNDFIGYLDAPVFIVYDLDELRSFVAYPRDDEDGPEAFHAVASVEVRMSFPHGVERLVLVDLPGLGEVDPKAEEYLVRELQDEVDLVLFIKRPTPATSYWSEHDSNVIRLVDRAKGDISELDDFCLLALNSNTDDAAETRRRQTLLRDIQEKSGFSRARILDCNAKRPTSVLSGVLKPALEHLVSRLPHMDRQIAQKALAEAESSLEGAQSIVRELGRVINIALRALGSAERDTDKRAAALHEELAVRMLEVLRDLDPTLSPSKSGEPEGTSPTPESRKSNPDALRAAYQDAIENAATAACALVDSEESLNFQQQYEARYAIDATPGYFLKNIYNYARVSIDRTICSYDDFLAEQVRASWNAFFRVLVENGLGPVLSETEESDSPGLMLFLERLERIESQCPEMTSALREFLKLSIRCESHFLHLYDQQLYTLNAMIRGSYGGAQGEQSGDFPNSREGSHQAYLQFFERAKTVINRIKETLCEAAPTPPRIIHACAFRFFDRFFRPESAREEFALFCQEYRELIWPQLARPAQVRRNLEALRTSCDKIAEASRRRALTMN